MKRTKFIDLNLMRKHSRKKFIKPIALTLSAVALSSCSKEDTVLVKNVEECMSISSGTYAECEAQYQKAIQEAEKTGPKFQSQSQCEVEFGRDYCYRPRGSSWFMPAMTGFLIGQMLNNNRSSYGFYRTPVPTFHYRGNGAMRGKMIAADGTVLGRAGQRNMSVNKSSINPKPRSKVTRTRSRGGFGSTVAAKSKWGGSRSGWGG